MAEATHIEGLRLSARMGGVAASLTETGGSLGTKATMFLVGVGKPISSSHHWHQKRVSFSTELSGVTRNDAFENGCGAVGKS